MAVLNGPSEKQFEVIQSQLGETDERLRENVSSLKKWIAAQPHMPKNYEAHLLPLFLRGCKHDLRRARSKLDEFYCSRSTCPELFGDWDPEDLSTINAAKLLEMAPLPQLTDEGYRVTIHRVREHDDIDFLLKDIIRLLLMLGDLRLEMETPIAGDIYVFDLLHVRASHWVKLATPLLKKILNIVQEAYPQRLNQIHIINAPNFINKIVNIFKGLMKEKMRNRFIVHASQETLSEYISKKILPSEYQGEAESLDNLNKLWMNKLQESKGRFQANSQPKADMSKKPMKKETVYQKNNIYGYEGTFRSLTID